jgi:hypothetical protein
MSLIPLTKRGDIRAAYERFARAMRRDSEKLRKWVGWHGGSTESNVFWRPAEQVWSVFEPDFAGNRYWCCFGIGDPTAPKMLSITCEINSPYVGLNLRTAGMFLRDDSGNVFIGHSGKIGGGKQGVGKRAFLSSGHGGPVVPVTMARGTRDMRVIGRVDSPRLPAQVARFARDVDSFKADVSASVPAVNTPAASAFTPEFSGTRKPYHVSGDVEAKCDHGLVVAALAAELRAREVAPCNTPLCDVFIQGAGGRMTHLFEVKTQLTTQDLYCAVGQLMVHGAAHDPPPRRVVVIPDEPARRTAMALRRLGLHVVSYEWDGSTPAFFGLSEVLK